MVLTNEQINEIIKKCKESSYDVRIRDISYIMLCHFYEDRHIAYKCIFGDEGSFSDYKGKEIIVFLESYMNTNVFPLFEKTTKTKKKSEEDITFEENKAYMLKLKKDTEAAMLSGDIDKKDGLKILADISVKLNDKFQVQNEVQEQMVIVNTKYDYICPNCNSEVARRPISKEEAIKMYGLIEKD